MSQADNVINSSYSKDGDNMKLFKQENFGQREKENDSVKSGRHDGFNQNCFYKDSHPKVFTSKS